MASALAGAGYNVQKNQAEINVQQYPAGGRGRYGRKVNRNTRKFTVGSLELQLWKLPNEVGPASSSLAYYKRELPVDVRQNILLDLLWIS